LQGLQAYQAGDHAKTIDFLSEPTGALDDWRLLILAESAHASDDVDLAAVALGSMIDEHRGSPIRSLAIQRAAEIAAEHELWDSALHWIEFARSEALPPEKSLAIETLAWEMGATQERPEVQARAGRQLLVEHPLAAAELDVERFFRDDSGALDWTRVLTQSELERRAERQIESRRSEDALETLALVPTDQRAFDWSLLRAEALTRDRQGREALEILDSLAASDAKRQIDVIWQRALAAREAARVRRGRNNLSRSRREEMRALARTSLSQVADLTSDAQQKVLALRVLFAMVSDLEDSFEPSLATLQRLQQLDPDDTTGTRYLWRLGWQAYTKRDYSVAIGYWSELEGLYPGTSNARSGRYWTGRSHEALGHGARAADVYRQILATQADDFYSRHARGRLEEDTPVAVETPLQPTEPWPEDPVLDRARWLSEAGFDELALHELDGLETVAERRAFCAQKAVVLAGMGQRRDSIRSLVCAFPALGKAHQSIVPEDALRLYYPLDFRSIIEQRATEQELPPNLVFAMVRQESAFDAEARSWAGARGLMQLMPATGKEVAQRLGLRYSSYRLNDPDFSVRLGTRYFRQVLDMFDGNQELALAGYNGGPYRIKKLWRQAGSQPELDRFVEGLSLEETKTYVKRILLFEDTYDRLYSEGT
jgi:soluble lytic murein transglycosylase-like protein